MKKQDWIPIPFWKNLCETYDEDAVDKLPMQMITAGVVDFEYCCGCAGLRMHDMTLTFTVKEAESNEGCAYCFGKVVDKYTRERGFPKPSRKQCLQQKWTMDAGVTKDLERRTLRKTSNAINGGRMIGKPE